LGITAVIGWVLWREVVGENGRYWLVFVERDGWGERPLSGECCSAGWLGIIVVVGWVLGREVVGENGRCGMGFVE